MFAADDGGGGRTADRADDTRLSRRAVQLVLIRARARADQFAFCGAHSRSILNRLRNRAHDFGECRMR